MRQPSPYAEAFLAQIAPKFAAEQATQYAMLAPDTYEIEAGQKYDRLVIQHQSHPYINGVQDRSQTVPGQRMVHAFVDRATGALYKAEGWNAPAKNKDGKPSVRYDLSTPEGLALAVESADRFSAYLYSGFVLHVPERQLIG